MICWSRNSSPILLYPLIIIKCSETYTYVPEPMFAFLLNWIPFSQITQTRVNVWMYLPCNISQPVMGVWENWSRGINYITNLQTQKFTWKMPKERNVRSLLTCILNSYTVIPSWSSTTSIMGKGGWTGESFLQTLSYYEHRNWKSCNWS